LSCGNRASSEEKRPGGLKAKRPIHDPSFRFRRTADLEVPAETTGERVSGLHATRTLAQGHGVAISKSLYFLKLAKNGKKI
jgi:hypothetical protein